MSDATADASGLADLAIADEAGMAELGRTIAAALAPGDLVALSGPIGAGKTTLARAILRAYLDDPGLDAPSPTFTLLQTYPGPRGDVVHADLYRIRNERELVELGFDELGDAAMLVEWPDRGGSVLDRPRLDVALATTASGQGRRAALSGSGPLVERMRRASRIGDLLERAGWSGAERRLMQGDASTRAFERLTKPDGETAILMISPRQPDGPPIRRGRPYSQIAKLAESVHAFVAVGRGLAGQGLSTPGLLAQDLEAGLVLLEDLGTDPVVDGEEPIPERYEAAARLLAGLHARTLPTRLPVEGDEVHALPVYDLEALLIEVDLLLDWYMPFVAGARPSGSVRAEFGHLWREVLGPIVAAPPTWTLRDFHSPNLIWLPERHGDARVGLVDFQDAVLGHPAYDVASLGQDARVTVPPALELRLLGAYAGARRAADPGFDTASFAASYAVMGAQRATKILGIFARLDRRDGKPHYLAHLPRVQSYLRRDLGHPALARLRDWYAAQMPAAFGMSDPLAVVATGEPSS